MVNQETGQEVDERILFMNGVIAEESWFDDDVTPALFKDELNAGTGDITLWINSPGGDCVAAAQIFNMLSEYPGKVTVKIDGLAASAASVIAMAGTEVWMSPVSMMMIHNPATVAWGDHSEMKKAMELLDAVKESIINAYVRASDEYRRAMLNALRSNFRQVSNTLQEGVDADGGYLVPEEYDRRLVDVLNEENIMRRLATRIVTSGEHKINIAATKPAASWIEEGGALTFGDATFDQKILDAHKLHVAIKVTEELLYDNAFNLENYIIVQFGKALANAEEDAFLNGNGTGKPTGIFDGTGGGHLLNTLAAALKSDDMLDLVYGLKRPYRKNASFIMNDVTLPSLRKLKDNNGAYIWQPAYQAGEPDRILGYKVETSVYAPKDGIAFGDYSYYNIGDRGNRSFKQLNELFAGNGMIGFVAKERVDGKLVLPEAVQIMKLKAD